MTVDRRPAGGGEGEPVAGNGVKLEKKWPELGWP